MARPAHALTHSHTHIQTHTLSLERSTRPRARRAARSRMKSPETIKRRGRRRALPVLLLLLIVAAALATTATTTAATTIVPEASVQELRPGEELRGELIRLDEETRWCVPRPCLCHVGEAARRMRAPPPPRALAHPPADPAERTDAHKQTHKHTNKHTGTSRATWSPAPGTS